ncbi:MAG: DUF58 domain-containing protein [Gemmatimonadota bacterium]
MIPPTTTADSSGPATRRPDLLSPEQLAELGGLELLARSLVEGFLLGLHRSPHRGFSAEFAELRGYRPGDDLRHIDWRMFARSDRFYVKQFEEETSLRAYLLLDVSASMDWSSRPDSLPTKLWYGRVLAGALSLLLLRQGDRAGLGVFDDQIRSWVPDRGGMRHWSQLLLQLRRAVPRGVTDPTPALRTAALRLRRRGLVILISDLLVDRDEVLRALGFLRHRGHQVMVFHLLDPGERELGGRGEVRFTDPETDEELRVDVSEIRDAYRDAVESALDGWRRRLLPRGIDYHVLDTSAPLGPGLRAVLSKRGRLG